MKGLLVLACTALLCVGAAQPAQAARADKLWEIVDQECVPSYRATHDPKPCQAVDLVAGYAVLKDIVGRSQYLLIPTTRIAGIESAALLDPQAPNYWRDAWQQRRLVGAALGRRLPRDALGLAINSVHARSQNQLHIHIDCVRTDVQQALHAQADTLPVGRWSPVTLDGRAYPATRLPPDGLVHTDPFQLLATGLPGAAARMADETLLVTGAIFADGRHGLLAVEDHAGSALGDRGGAEVWLDHDCAIAQTLHAGS